MLTAVLGCLASLAVLVLGASWERRVARLTLETKASQHLEAMNNGLRDSDFALDTVRAFLESSEAPVGRMEFERFAHALHRGVPGLRDIGWAPRVAAEDREVFERATGLAILRRDHAGHIVASDPQADYYPIMYFDSDGPRRPPLGLNIAYSPERRATVQRAIASGRAAATPPVSLVSLPRRRAGVLAFRTVKLASDGTPRAQPSGLVFGAFESAAMIEHVLSQDDGDDGLAIYFFDPTGSVDDRLIYWRSDPDHPQPAPSETSLRARLHWEGRVRLLDQSWGVLFVPAVPLGLLSGNVWAFLPGGFAMLLTVLAVAYVWMSQRRTEQLERLTASLRDTSEGLRRKTEEASHLAGHDPLTGLPNRRLFHEQLERAVARVRRGGAGCAVLHVDLDRFKPINDVYGHKAGDAVLCEMARRLRTLVRSSDMAARLGGDEFAAVLEGEDTAAGVERLAERLVAVMAQPVQLGELVLDVGASIGLAVCPDDATEPAALLHAADLAMYAAKRQGRGKSCRFDPAMDAALRCRAELEKDLRRAIAEGEIQPYFQPLVALDPESLLGFEVLARWLHPGRGLIPPDAFIPVAEETGLIPDMTYSLLRRACAEARTWPGHLVLALNISPSQLRDRGLPSRLLDILAETGFAPRRLEVEITEAALVGNVDVARANLTQLQEAGVRVSLDDFGTGYSSLAHLRQLTFDKIKIDRTFVTSMQQDAANARIVKAVIGLGNTLGVATTAEGIETSAVARDLVALGCSTGQGYYFGRPMPAALLPSFLARSAQQLTVAALIS